MNTGVDIIEKAKKVKSRNDFLDFLNDLKVDYIENRHEWENDDIESYVNGIECITHGLDGWFLNQKINFDPEIPSWSSFAIILLCASNYS